MFCKLLVFIISLISQYYYKLNFLTLIPQLFSLTLFITSWATISCPGFCHVRNFTYLSAAIRKTIKSQQDMAKIQIKSEKLTPFGGIFLLWNSILSLMKSSWLRHSKNTYFITDWQTIFCIFASPNIGWRERYFNYVCPKGNYSAITPLWVFVNNPNTTSRR